LADLLQLSNIVYTKLTETDNVTGDKSASVKPVWYCSKYPVRNPLVSSGGAHTNLMESFWKFVAFRS